MPHGFSGFKNKAISPQTAVRRGQFDTVFHINYSRLIEAMFAPMFLNLLVQVPGPGAFNARIQVQAQQPGLFSLFEAPTYDVLDPLTEILPWNTHRQSPIPPQSFFFTEPPILTDGTALIDNLPLNTGTFNNTMIDNGGVGGEFTVLQNMGEDYLLRIETLSRVEAYFGISILFYEPPELSAVNVVGVQPYDP